MLYFTLILCYYCFMNSFYEIIREKDSALVITRGKDHTFNAHYHQNLEILIVVSGEYLVTVNGEKYHLKGGSIAVSDSYDIHAYERVSSGNNDDIVIIVPFKDLYAFNALKKGMVIDGAAVSNKALVDELIYIIDNYLYSNKVEVKESALNLFLSLVYSSLKFKAEKNKNDGVLIRKMLVYLHENFRSPISRSTMAMELGYTESHLSKIFHAYLNCGIKEYINALRHEYANKLKRETDKSLTEIISEAGFLSQQTYYRTKKK